MTDEPEEIVDYWYREVGPTQWFKDDAKRDAELKRRYTELYERAANGGLTEWETTPTGMLALMLLLDQFPRHMFRGTPKAFATDDMALELARMAIIKHFDDRIDAAFKLCFYLPFAHAENMGDQRLAIFYIRERTKNAAWLDYAEVCYNTVQRFDRFPERNQVLGRASSKAEEDFLAKQQLAKAG